MSIQQAMLSAQVKGRAAARNFCFRANPRRVMQGKPRQQNPRVAGPGPHASRAGSTGAEVALPRRETTKPPGPNRAKAPYKDPYNSAASASAS